MRAVGEVDQLLRLVERESRHVDAGRGFVAGVRRGRRVAQAQLVAKRAIRNAARPAAVTDARKLAVPVLERHPHLEEDLRLARRGNRASDAAERRKIRDRVRRARRRHRSHRDRLGDGDRRIRQRLCCETAACRWRSLRRRPRAGRRNQQHDENRNGYSADTSEHAHDPRSILALRRQHSALRAGPSHNGDSLLARRGQEATVESNQGDSEAVFAIFDYCDRKLAIATCNGAKWRKSLARRACHDAPRFQFHQDRFCSRLAADRAQLRDGLSAIGDDEAVSLSDPTEIPAEAHLQFPGADDILGHVVIVTTSDVTCRAIAGRQWGLLVARPPRPSSSEEPPFDQQSTTERARPASLVSLYLLFISFAVWASANTVSSKLIRCLDAISLLAIA